MGGYLEEILVKEGQAVKKGDVLFKILHVFIWQSTKAEDAEADLAELKANNTKKLTEENVVSQNEVKLAQAQLATDRPRGTIGEGRIGLLLHQSAV